MEKTDSIKYQEKTLSTDKNFVQKKPYLEKIDKTKFKHIWIIILITIIIIILGLTSFLLWYFLVFKKKKKMKNEDKEIQNKNEKILDNDNDLINYEKQLKAS